MEPDILLIDLDHVLPPFPKEKYGTHAREVLQRFGYTLRAVSYKPSQRKGIHVAVWVNEPVQPQHIPLLQYLLGSDPKRECINYFRMKWGIDLNVLFTAKGKYISRNDAETDAEEAPEEVPNQPTDVATPTFRTLVKNFELCPEFKKMVEELEKSGVRRYEPSLDPGLSTL